MEVELRITSDGSHTLYLAELDETYHSLHGALQESRHVFINHGLNFFCKKNPDKKIITVFEMGFGTGLNALLTMQFAVEKQVQVRYTTIEKFPLPEEIVKTLNYTQLSEFIPYQEDFIRMHQAPAGAALNLGNFNFRKDLGDILSYSFMRMFDVVFWDAFAPSIVPELWTSELFTRLRTSMNPGGVLTTYSSKGDVKRNIRAAGFNLERLPGAPGKRHMLRAINL